MAQIAQLGARRSGSSFTMIVCPYHPDRSPSGRLSHGPHSRSPGFFSCYACGVTAPWDEVAPRLGLKPFRWSPPEVQTSVQILKPTQVQEELVFSPLPPSRYWRGIPTDLLIKLGARLSRPAWAKSNMLYLPVVARGNLRGFIQAQLRKKPGSPSYLNSKGAWSEDGGLFPYDYATRENPRTIVLVEGPRDALSLLANGIPAIAILGTHSWSQKKNQLLELSGADNIVLCMDGDRAGIEATKMLAPKLRTMFSTHVFDLAGSDSPFYPFRASTDPSADAREHGVEFWDPATLPRAKIDELRVFIQNIEDRTP